MYELKKIGKVFMSKFVGTGPSSYKRRIYRAAVSEKLRNTDLEDTQISLKLQRGQRKSEVARHVPPSEQRPNYYLAGK